MPQTDNKITIRLIKDCRTTGSGYTLLAGRVGNVVGLNDTGGRYFWIADFGLPVVVSLPFDSPLCEVLPGGER